MAEQKKVKCKVVGRVFAGGTTPVPLGTQVMAVPDGVYYRAVGGDKLEVATPKVGDVVKLIEACETLDALMEYESDDRKGVKSAFDAKLEQLSAE